MPTQEEYRKFYAQLFSPIEVQVGAIDKNTLSAIIGFDAGGPLNFCTVGNGREKFVTYVSCELAVRDDQKFGETGPFEVMRTIRSQSSHEHWAHVSECCVCSQPHNRHQPDC